MRSGFQCYFLTLTSAPDSPPDRLRRDWQALRKRIAREYDVEPSVIQYRGVDTTEGHGVLHFLVAVPAGWGGAKGYFADFKWLQQAWTEIHGAFHVNVKRVKHGDGHARRLSRYLVTQYVSDQDALVRMSGSRSVMDFAKLRRSLRALVFDHGARYKAAVVFAGSGEGEGEGGSVGGRVAGRAPPDGSEFRAEWWRLYKAGFRDLVMRGSFQLWGDTVVLFGGEVTVL